MYVPGKHIIDPAPKTKKKKEKSQVLFFVFNFVFVERWDLKFGITQKPQALC